MKKNYNAPVLTVHGSVETITQWLGNTDKNDFLFFNASATTPIGGNPGTGDGSEDGFLDNNGDPKRKGTLRGNPI